MTADNAAMRYLLDSWLDWARAEGPPLFEGVVADLATAPLAAWPRMGAGVTGAFARLEGRGDFLGAHVIEIPAHGATRPARHLFDEVYFALSGEGELRVGEAATRFRAGSLFSPPLNALFSIVNAGASPARLACVSNLPFQMNFFRSVEFLFDNPFPPPADAAVARVVDIGAVALEAGPARGEGFSRADIDMDAGALHTHIGELAPGRCARARRHGPGAHLISVSGEGYWLVHPEGAGEATRFDWRPGLVLSPSDSMFIQPFNTGATPARWLVVSLGNPRRPLLARKQFRLANAGRDLDAGGSLLPQSEEPPGVRAELKTARAGGAA